MQESEVLQTIAEIGIALTGFTGVVVALGRRARGDWNEVEMLQLYMLLAASLLVVFFSLLPFVVIRLYPDVLWRISAGLFALADLGVFLFYCGRGLPLYRKREQLGSIYPMSGLALAIGLAPIGLFLIGCRVAVAIGAMAESAGVIYLASLLFVLLGAAVNFVYLLLPRQR